MFDVYTKMHLTFTFLRNQSSLPTSTYDGIYIALDTDNAMHYWQDLLYATHCATIQCKLFLTHTDKYWTITWTNHDYIHFTVVNSLYTYYATHKSSSGHSIQKNTFFNRLAADRAFMHAVPAHLTGAVTTQEDHVLQTIHTNRAACL